MRILKYKLLVYDANQNKVFYDKYVEWNEKNEAMVSQEAYGGEYEVHEIEGDFDMIEAINKLESSKEV